MLGKLLRDGGANMGFSQRIDTILNWSELNWTERRKEKKKTKQKTTKKQQQIKQKFFAPFLVLSTLESSENPSVSSAIFFGPTVCISDVIEQGRHMCQLKYQIRH